MKKTLQVWLKKCYIVNVDYRGKNLLYLLWLSVFFLNVIVLQHIYTHQQYHTCIYIIFGTPIATETQMG